MINPRKLAEEQKNLRALKIKNIKLNQTHYVKLAEPLSPKTKKLDEVKQSTHKLGVVIKESNSKNQTPHLAIENTPTHQPIENNERVITDVELENSFKNMENDNTGFFKTYHDPQRGWMLINYPNKMLSGTMVKTHDKKYNITPGVQKVFVNSTYDTAKSMNDTEKID